MSLRDVARVDAAAQLEGRTDGTHHRMRAVEAEVSAQPINRLNPRAMRANEIVHAKLPQFPRRPREGRLTGVEQVDAADQGVDARRPEKRPGVVDRVLLERRLQAALARAPCVEVTGVGDERFDIRLANAAPTPLPFGCDRNCRCRGTIFSTLAFA